MEMPFEGRMGGKTEEAFLRSKNKMYKSGELDGELEKNRHTNIGTDRQIDTNTSCTYIYMDGQTYNSNAERVMEWVED